jgi:ATP-dependent Clp protease ATP-binding subunit ClpC
MGISIELTKQAKEYLAEKGYDPAFGARPLRRALQRYIEDPVAEEILKGKYPEGSTIKVRVSKKTGELKFSSSAPAKTPGDVSKEEEKKADVS